LPFEINELRSSISKHGVQKASHFTAMITLPSSVPDSDGIMGDAVIRVNSINLPGVNFGLDEIRHKGFGLGEKRPLSASYDDISLTLIADGQGKLASTLHRWMEFIFPSDIARGADGVEYFEYPNNYYGGLEITMYDTTGEKHTTFNFIQPFPSNIGGMQMSWDSVDNLLLLPVTFSYRSYVKNSSHSGQSAG
jgi:hypothetical protein